MASILISSQMNYSSKSFPTWLPGLFVIVFCLFADYGKIFLKATEARSAKAKIRFDIFFICARGKSRFFWSSIIGTNLEMTQCSGHGLILVTVMKIPTWQWWKQSPWGSSSCPVWHWKTSVLPTKWSGCYCTWATIVLGCVKFTCSIAHSVQRLWCDWVKCVQTSRPYRWYVAMKTTGKTTTCGPTCGTAPLSKHFQLWLHCICSGLWL